MSAHRARRASVLVVLVLSTFAVAGPARADSVTAWNEIATDALIRDGGQGAIAIANLAMVHGAVYDAVNAIDGRHEPYLVAPAARRWYSRDAAAATAAYRVLVDSRPPVVPAAQQPALAARLKPLYDAALATIPPGAAKDGGIATGNAAADAMIAARTDDGRFGPFRFTAGSAVGAWRPEVPDFISDPGAWLKDVKPFLIGDASKFRGLPPNPLTSAKYAKEFEEVKTVGAADSTTRTDDQTKAAQFWGLANAPGTWSDIFRRLAIDRGGSVADNARLFAMLYLTGADALITTWIDKARYSYWRPITAIHEAGEDGNPATKPDAKWMPLIATPPYPDHPSGLAALGGAAVRTLQAFYGTDEATFGTTNAAKVPITRTYTRFSQAIEEIVDARVWSGIHFRLADEQGAAIGEAVAEFAEDRFARLSCPPRGARSAR
jgi:hypothetical protein